MCGIVGIYSSRNLTIDVASLEKSTHSLAHRGPDDSGLFVNSSVNIGLGHRRLSILDLSAYGHQPMHADDNSAVLVFNGEIYNFREIRLELESKGFVFKGNSDTEVLLKLYLSEGSAMLPRLNGVFAFALWDSRKNALLIARDALGVKPLYFTDSKKGFAFASEIKALLNLMPDARELDIASLHRYLSFLWCPGEGTLFKSVRKLGPGEAIWVKDGHIEKHWTWYQLPVFRGVLPDLDQSSAISGTASHLRQAVHRQMIADVPVGAFLSGGLDSSAIVSFAKEINPNIHCFTIESLGGQENGVIDDLPYARKVAHHLGLPLDIASINPNRIAADLEQMVSQLDEPLADPASLNVLYISQLAREQGIKVLLSGAGGDDLFTGYRRHRAIQAERYWSWLPRQVRSGLTQITNCLDQNHVITRRISKLFKGAALEGDERIIDYFRWIREADILSLYTPEARNTLGSELAATPMINFLKPLSSAIKPLDKMLALEQHFFLADHNLIYTDKMSMAASIEVRVPFLDLSLVDFAARIPLNLKQHGSEGKWVLKKAMEPYLPHEVIYRPKTGFGVPLRRWMQHDLRDLLGDLLSPDSLQKRGLFESSAVNRLISDNDSGKIDASYTLLSLLSIEIWCRNYID